MSAEDKHKLLRELWDRRLRREWLPLAEARLMRRYQYISHRMRKRHIQGKYQALNSKYPTCRMSFGLNTAS